MSAEPTVLFRCDGSPSVGLGHVVRCLALADELREVYGCRIAFAMREGPLGFEMVLKKGYQVLNSGETPESFKYAKWLSDICRDTGCKVLILDVRDELSRADLECLRRENILIVAIDDPSERRLAADLVFYPPVPQVQKLNWQGFRGQLFVGWEWIILRREFGYRTVRAQNPSPVVLVTMGGSDPSGLTITALKALALLNEDFQTIVLLGPGFSYHVALRELLAKTRHRRFELFENVTNVPGLMNQADLAVASFGVTAYELAAMGVPAIYFGLTSDHVESASTFVDAGIAVCLGIASEVTAQMAAEAVEHLLADEAARLKMACQARKKIDAQGAQRIVRALETSLSGHQ